MDSWHRQFNVARKHYAKVEKMDTSYPREFTVRQRISITITQNKLDNARRFQKYRSQNRKTKTNGYKLHPSSTIRNPQTSARDWIFLSFGEEHGRKTLENTMKNQGMLRQTTKH